MLREVIFILRKEFEEFTHTSIKFLFIMLLPFISSAFIAFQDGSGGVLPPTINILCSFLFSAFFATILIRDSIIREKEESTIQILLLSKFNFFNIIVGKILLCVIVGSIFQIFQTILMYGILYQSNSLMLNLFNIKILIILPLISYLMGSTVLLISVLINDKKTGEFLSMIITLFVGSLTMIAYNYIWKNILIAILYLIFIMLINIFITIILKKILVKSMFFIKK